MEVDNNWKGKGPGGLRNFTVTVHNCWIVGFIQWAGVSLQAFSLSNHLFIASYKCQVLFFSARLAQKSLQNSIWIPPKKPSGSQPWQWFSYENFHLLEISQRPAMFDDTEAANHGAFVRADRSRLRQENLTKVEMMEFPLQHTKCSSRVCIYICIRIYIHIYIYIY